MQLTIEEALESSGDSLESACALLWSLDTNRLNPIHDYTLNPQSRIEGYRDNADEKLIVSFSDDVWSRPTYASFRRLLDNYTAETGVPEVVSADELSEQSVFISAISETPCIQFAYQWLLAQSFTDAETIEDFANKLHDIWFHLYSRDASRDSSAFEHVFIGELDDGKVKGLHNFIQVYLEEMRGNFNYIGYLDPRGSPSSYPPPPSQQFITLRFEWLGETKPVSSMFVGPSPEFEFALYTMMFLSGQDTLELTLGPYTAKIKVYEMYGCIGSAFPELLHVDLDALPTEEDCAVEEPYQEQEVPGEDAFPELGEQPQAETENSWGRPTQEDYAEPEGQPENAWGQPDEAAEEAAEEATEEATEGEQTSAWGRTTTEWPQL